MRARLSFAASLLIFAGLVVASSLVGTPHDRQNVETLPSVAMGWRLLFHIERATMLAGAIGLIALVAWRGAHGEWPIKFGNVEYAPKEAVRVTADALEKQDRRLRLLEELTGAVDTADHPHQDER